MAEVMRFWYLQPVFKKITLADLNSLKQKSCLNPTWYFMIPPKIFFSKNIEIKLNSRTWMSLKSSVVIFQALEPLQPQWPQQPIIWIYTEGEGIFLNLFYFTLDCDMDGGSERNTVGCTFTGWHLALVIFIYAKTNIFNQNVVDTIGFNDIELAPFASTLDFGAWITCKK